MISSNRAFCSPSFLSGFPLFFSASCFASTSFVTLAGCSSLPQPLLLTKERHASVAASATQPAPAVGAAVAKVSPSHPWGHWTMTAPFHPPAHRHKTKWQCTEVKPNQFVFPFFFFFKSAEVKKLVLQGIQVPKLFTC